MRNVREGRRIRSVLCGVQFPTVRGISTRIRGLLLVASSDLLDGILVHGFLRYKFISNVARLWHVECPHTDFNRFLLHIFALLTNKVRRRRTVSKEQRPGSTYHIHGFDLS